MLSKIILAVLLFKFFGKLGLRSKLRNLKPQLERAVNITLVVLAVAYAGQLIYWFIQHRAAR